MSDSAASAVQEHDATVAAPAAMGWSGILADSKRLLRVLIPAGILAYVSWQFGSHLTVLGPAVTAMVLGAAISSTLPLSPAFRTDAARLGGRILRITIVILGGSIDAQYVARTAGNSLVVMLGTLTVGLVGIWQLGKRLGVEERLRSLIAVGTSICGVSAIAAAAPAVEATSADISYAVSVVVIFNIAAVVTFPVIAHLAGFSSHTFGVWAGTAINDTSSVLAAGYAFGSGAATFAAVVKLSRVIMILPVTFAMALVHSHEGETGRPRRGPLTMARSALPWFVIGFVLLSIGRSLGFWSAAVAKNDFGKVASYGVALALATIGLSTNLFGVMRANRRGLLLGGMGWILLASTSLALQGLMSLL